MRYIKIEGLKFGRLLVIKRVDDKTFPSGQKQTQYLCKCDCGKEVFVLKRNLMTGNTKSCGCLALEFRTVHDKWGTKIYKVWDNMKSRCFNPKAQGYKNWGGRGITVYPEWIHSFDSFYKYVSKLEHYGEVGYSLDRINNDGNYEPGNLRWATKSEQAKNSRPCLKLKGKRNG